MCSRARREQMYYWNCEDLEPQTAFLFVIFREACTTEWDETKALNGYVKFWKENVFAVGRVFQWLGLAEPDEESVIGWKASSLLMGLMVINRRGRLSRKTTVSQEDIDTFDLIVEAALGNKEDWSDSLGFIWDCLRVVGLVMETQEGELAPTRLLRELAVERRTNDRDDRIVARL